MDKGKNKVTKTVDIEVYGIVQGVGFRPFTAKLADKYGIKGQVCNHGGYVKIKATSSIGKLADFINGLSYEKPKQAEIVHIKASDTTYENFEKFSIEESSEMSTEVVMLPVDLPICEECLKEMQDSSNHRFNHPFISCMACGPRYSIIDRVPYDRCNTSMADFKMCKSCTKEYTSREDRRYHAQTISCTDCGPHLIYINSENIEVIEEEAFNAAVKEINNGKIIAVKGVGGYHFACSPFNSSVVEKLRDIKLREEKPFAVMFKNIEEIETYCEVTPLEKALLQSNATPIVLLKRKASAICESVYKDSRFLGAFLPYTALQHMIIDKCGPLIMTSANLSHLPIIKEVEEIFQFISRGLTGILYNKRDIRVRLDDSVAKICGGETQIIRRSRGYVPMPIYLTVGKLMPKFTVFAAGAQLKASFCLAKGQFTYPSEYFGDLEEEPSYKVYKESYEHMKELLNILPELAVCDMHPRYFTTAFAEKLNIPLLKVQHHHAHIGSVMAEHNLHKVIGVAFDGTGYGPDGAIWGGEFLLCSGSDYERFGHLKYINILGGDESMKDARKTACCYLIVTGMEEFITDERKDIIISAIKNHINTWPCSSMGRLFDAISSILNICQYNGFEGECAVKLENMAAKAKEMGIKPINMSFDIFEENNEIIIDASSLLKSIINTRYSRDERACEAEVYALALGFHYSVVDMVLSVINIISKKSGIKDVALSGGVFQNSILLESCLEVLRGNGYKVYINNKVPPNDSGIALGQAYIGMQSLKRE
jgi:hydrogenase maturation protein HypF